jgi:hypothetical protein
MVRDLTPLSRHNFTPILKGVGTIPIRGILLDLRYPPNTLRNFSWSASCALNPWNVILMN